MVKEPVQQADGGGVLGKESAPVLKAPVRGDGQGPAFVGGCDEAEQQLGAGVVQWCEADFIKNDEVVAEQRVDGLTDGVVGQDPVEGLDQVGGGEVPDAVPGVHGGVAKGYQGV